MALLQRGPDDRLTRWVTLCHPFITAANPTVRWH